MPKLWRRAAATSPNSAAIAPLSVTRVPWQSGSNPLTRPASPVATRTASASSVCSARPLASYTSTGSRAPPQSAAPRAPVSAIATQRRPVAPGAPLAHPAGGLADLDHPHVRLLAPDVGGDRAQHALERIHAQERGVLGQRVHQLHGLGIDGAAQELDPRGVGERVRDDLGEPRADQRAPDGLALAQGSWMGDQ